MQSLFKTTGLQFKYSISSPFQLSTGAFDILEYQSIAIVGPSGGGKSTLLRLIDGSLKNSSPVLNKPESTAMIFQDLRLVLEKSALENTLMGAFSRISPHQVKFTPELKQEACELLKELGLDELSDVPVSHLSGGQKQRVAIARALMSAPQILLADEPFSHLDHPTALETMKLLKKLQNKIGFALVVTIHDKALADYHFDYIWSVEQGKLYTQNNINNLELENLLGSSTNSDQNIKVKDWQKLDTLVFVSILFLMFISFITLPTQGFNSENAFSELIIFFKKVFLPSSESLAQVKWSYLIERLLLTLQMAFTGTAVGFFISLPLGFLSADGLAPNYIRKPLRSLLMVIRSIPSLIWALFFVAAFGLGTVSGVLALSVYSIGYFTKFLYEGIEDLERKPYLAVRRLGASRLQAALHVLLPTSKPLIISSLIFMLEYNVRSASLLGLVGAGGIGQDMMYALEWRDFATVFAILILMITVVVIFDWVSLRVRKNYKKLRGI